MRQASAGWSGASASWSGAWSPRSGNGGRGSITSTPCSNAPPPLRVWKNKALLIKHILHLQFNWVMQRVQHQSWGHSWNWVHCRELHHPSPYCIINIEVHYWLWIFNWGMVRHLLQLYPSCSCQMIPPSPGLINSPVPGGGLTCQQSDGVCLQVLCKHESRCVPVMKFGPEL